MSEYFDGQTVERKNKRKLKWLSIREGRKEGGKERQAEEKTVGVKRIKKFGRGAREGGVVGQRRIHRKIEKKKSREFVKHNDRQINKMLFPF